MIRKEGDQWCLYTSDGSRKLGCHDSEGGALAQERAIQFRKTAVREEYGSFLHDLEDGEACEHDTQEAAEEHLAELEAGRHASLSVEEVEEICVPCARTLREQGIERISVSRFAQDFAGEAPDPVITVDEVEEVCKPCAKSMREAGIRALKLANIEKTAPDVAKALREAGGPGSGWFREKGHVGGSQGGGEGGGAPKDHADASGENLVSEAVSRGESRSFYNRGGDKTAVVGIHTALKEAGFLRVTNYKSHKFYHHPDGRIARVTRMDQGRGESLISVEVEMGSLGPFRKLRSTAAFRTGLYEGREHIIVPVVALVEGVLQASNASTPELVLAEDFKRSLEGWNGRPVVLNHPEMAGGKVSANDPEVLEKYSFGRVFNARLDDTGKKLLMDAYLDPEKAERVGPDAVKVIEKAKASENVEVSVGTFVVAEEAKGAYKGKPYHAKWTEIIPDHLAALPEGTPGACSPEMGCGLPRAAAAGRPGMVFRQTGGPGSGWFREKGHTSGSQVGKEGGGGSGRSTSPKAFVGKHQDFVKKEFERVGAATVNAGGLSFDLSGRGENPRTGKGGNILVMSTGDEDFMSGMDSVFKTIPDALSAIYKHAYGGKGTGKGGRKASSWVQKLLSFFSEAAETPEDREALLALAEPMGPSTDEIRMEVQDALKKLLDPSGVGVPQVYVDTVYPEDKLVVYCVGAGIGGPYFLRSYEKYEDGKILFGQEIEEVERKTVFEPVAAAPGSGSEQVPTQPSPEEARTMDARMKALAAKLLAMAKKKEAAKKDDEEGKGEAKLMPLVEKLLPQTTLEALAQLPPGLVAELEALQPEALVALEAVLKAIGGVTTAAADEGMTEEERKKKLEEEAMKTAEGKDGPLSEEKFLEQAPESIRELVAAQKAQRAARNKELLTLMKGVKQDAYSQQELEAMPLPQLEKVVRLAAKPQIDQSGRAMPRAASDDEKVPPPPSMVERFAAKAKASAA